MLKRFNWHTATLTDDPERPAGYRAAGAEIGPAIGGAHLGGGLLVIPAGEHSWPYHWEAGREEWLIVLEGRPTVRHPDGEHELRPGDVVCFSAGPRGAHKLTNRTAGEVRIILISDQALPNVVFYPDSGKVGVRASPDHRLRLRADAAVDYWEGER